ncbi:MAG: decaprenyl-phosphate phosphoribosyltransferase [bacterium]
MRAVVNLIRPAQWLKNFFLFAPLIFSKHLFELSYVATAGQAFVVFSLLSSTVYVLNDLADREADKLHPTKRNRPIATGIISVTQGILIAVTLLVLVILCSLMLPGKFMIVGGVYLLLNLAYSFSLKKVFLLDVFLVASGFMLRVLAGAFAIDVEVSHWLILCTLFISLFLAISKRRGELLLVKNSEEYAGRPVLREYEVEFIDQIMTIVAAGMAISYALYTVADRTVIMFGTENLIFTTVFVLFGIFRYLHLMRKKKTDDNPTHLLSTDPVTLVNITAYCIVCVLIIYGDIIKGWF